MRGRGVLTVDDDDGWEWGSVLDWSVDDVCEYIMSTGLPQYLNCFRGNNVTGKRLLRIKNSNLVEMGITTWDDQKIIFAAIKEAQERATGIRSMTKLSYRGVSSIGDTPKNKVPAEKNRTAQPAHSEDEDEDVVLDEDEDEDEDDFGTTPLASPSNKNANMLNEAENSQKHKADPDILNKAATIIQRRARGIAGRQRFNDIKEGKIDPLPKEKRGGKKKKKSKEMSKDEAAIIIQRRARGMAGRQRFRDVREGVVEPLPKQKRPKVSVNVLKFTDEQNRAAIKIQARARGMAGRQRFRGVQSGEVEPHKKEKRKVAS